jgi:hypothetical protein
MVDDFFAQLSTVWRQIDTLGSQLSPATCQSCKDQKADLELCRMYNFLTQLRDEFEPLRAQLLACHPCVSVMDVLAEVRNDETRIRDVGLLQSSSVLVAHCLVASPAAPVPLTSALVTPSAARGESVGLHCDHYGRDGHVKAF